MMLEGTVSNVAAFGAFVDIGVHQDGLVHVSQLADRFVKDPHEIVKAGDVVKVRVVEIDIPRKRIALSMRRDGGDTATPRAPAREDSNKPKRPAPPPQQKPQKRPPQPTGAFGAALADALKKK